MKKIILITGVNGFLGSHLVKRLEHEFEIIGLVSASSKLNRIKDQKIEVYESRKEIIEEVFKTKNIYAVIHAATIYRIADDSISALLTANIYLPVLLLELSKKHHVHMFFNTDSFFTMASDSHSYLSEYTLSKKQILDWITMFSKNSKCKVINMRVYHMYGKNDSTQKFIPFIIDKLVQNTHRIPLTYGEQKRDFIYVEDVVSSFVFILKNYSVLKEFNHFDVASGYSYSIREVVTLIKRMVKSTSVLNFGAIPYREGEIMDAVPEKLELQKLGWRPSYGIQDGLRICIEEKLS